MHTYIGWAVAWPAEVVKSRVQGDTSGTMANKSTLTLIKDIARKEVCRQYWVSFAP